MNIVLGVCPDETSFKTVSWPCGAQKIAFMLIFGLKLKIPNNKKPSNDEWNTSPTSKILHETI